MKRLRQIASTCATKPGQQFAVRSMGTLRARGQWSRVGGVSPLSLLTFFALAPRRKSPWGTKKVSAAPHRGNASAAEALKRMPAKAEAYPRKGGRRQKP